MLSTAHRTNVVLDENIVQEALKLSQIKTKRALIDTALKEFIANHKKPNIMDLLGMGSIDKDYDYKALRGRDHLPKLK
ncbi:MAG: type II toxin-antitoxin system VapB family antitoxin [Methylococcales symbiont of Hymedesmia sp. n. MRB-2018]|nr:MAG: type II toxin-antitoxin system VapB family antitoxin [Methylococcales symbiont of Hymedesmia sp. n. MRB-2018]